MQITSSNQTHYEVLSRTAEDLAVFLQQRTLHILGKQIKKQSLSNIEVGWLRGNYATRVHYTAKMPSVPEHYCNDVFQYLIDPQYHRRRVSAIYRAYKANRLAPWDPVILNTVASGEVANLFKPQVETIAVQHAQSTLNQPTLNQPTLNQPTLNQPIPAQLITINQALKLPTPPVVVTRTVQKARPRRRWVKKLVWRTFSANQKRRFRRTGRKPRLLKTKLRYAFRILNILRLKSRKLQTKKLAKWTGLLKTITRPTLKVVPYRVIKYMRPTFDSISFWQRHTFTKNTAFYEYLFTNHSMYLEMKPAPQRRLRKSPAQHRYPRRRRVVVQNPLRRYVRRYSLRYVRRYFRRRSRRYVRRQPSVRNSRRYVRTQRLYQKISTSRPISATTARLLSTFYGLRAPYTTPTSLLILKNVKILQIQKPPFPLTPAAVVIRICTQNPVAVIINRLSSSPASRRRARRIVRRRRFRQFVRRYFLKQTAKYGIGSLKYRYRYNYGNEKYRLNVFRNFFKRKFARFRHIGKNRLFINLFRAYFKESTGYREKELMFMWFQFRRKHTKFWGPINLVSRFAQSVLLTVPHLTLFFGIAPTLAASHALVRLGAISVNGTPAISKDVFARPGDTIQLVCSLWAYARRIYFYQQWSYIKLKLSNVSFFQVDWSLLLFSLVTWPKKYELTPPSYLSERWIRYYIRHFPLRQRKYQKVKMVWKVDPRIHKRHRKINIVK